MQKQLVSQFALTVAVAAPLTCTSVAAQLTWSKAQVPGDGAIAFDTARGRLVLAGAETWEWDGSAWHTASAFAPAGVAAYDSGAQRVVVVGGSSANFERWLWDGTAWTRSDGAATPPTAAPAGKFDASYDSARNCLVLHVGDGRAETWEHDGTAWSQRTPQMPPSAVSGFTMAFDATRGVTVLTGGADLPVRPYWDTWEWDGTEWTLFGGSPYGRHFADTTFDPINGTVVLYGGRTVPYATGDFYSWSGQQWVRNNAASWGVREAHGLAFDTARGKLLLLGGYTAYYAAQYGRPYGAKAADLWSWDGTSWTFEHASHPIARSGHAMAGDPLGRGVLLYGGTLGMGAHIPHNWLWNGSAWMRTGADGPCREGHAMALDRAAGHVLLFAGANEYGQEQNDTWTWDGSSWTQIATGGPPARWNHAMAHHDSSGRTYVFGGQGVAGRMRADTWMWDGISWSQLIVPGPPPRSRHVMVYDRARDVSIMFGGLDATGPLRDTWSWDGSQWTLLSPATTPSGGVMTYDELRERIVLFDAPAGAVWEWDGTDWLARTPSGPAPTRADVGIAWDPIRQRLVVAGGEDTHELFTTNVAEATSYGAACPGSATTPSLAAASLPWLGESYALQLGGVPAGQPAAVFLGGSQWMVPLAVIGAPGCSLLTSSELVTPLTAVGGTATWSVELALDPVLAGLRFYNQGVFADFGANPLGIALSDGICSQIGAR